MMNKNKLLKIVNGILALMFISTAAGGITRFFAPSVIPYDTFRLFHPISGLIFVGIVIIHVTLNFAWIKKTYLTKKLF